MRDALAMREGERTTYRGRVVRLGTRPRLANLRELTICLRDVSDADGLPVADHLWLALGKRLAAVDPHPGDLVEFSATVKAYHKGRLRRLDGTVTVGELDYKLAYPQAVRKVNSGRGRTHAR